MGKRAYIMVLVLLCLGVEQVCFGDQPKGGHAAVLGKSGDSAKAATPSVPLRTQAEQWAYLEKIASFNPGAGDYDPRIREALLALSWPQFVEVRDRAFQWNRNPPPGIPIERGAWINATYSLCNTARCMELEHDVVSRLHANALADPKEKARLDDAYWNTRRDTVAKALAELDFEARQKKQASQKADTAVTRDLAQYTAEFSALRKVLSLTPPTNPTTGAHFVQLFYSAPAQFSERLMANRSEATAAMTAVTTLLATDGSPRVQAVYWAIRRIWVLSDSPPPYSSKAAPGTTLTVGQSDFVLAARYLSPQARRAWLQTLSMPELNLMLAATQPVLDAPPGVHQQRWEQSRLIAFYAVRDQINSPTAKSKGPAPKLVLTPDERKQFVRDLAKNFAIPTANDPRIRSWLANLSWHQLVGFEKDLRAWKTSPPSGVALVLSNIEEMRDDPITVSRLHVNALRDAGEAKLFTNEYLIERRDHLVTEMTHATGGLRTQLVLEHGLVTALLTARGAVPVSGKDGPAEHLALYFHDPAKFAKQIVPDAAKAKALMVHIDAEIAKLSSNEAGRRRLAALRTAYWPLARRYYTPGPIDPKAYDDAILFKGGIRPTEYPMPAAFPKTTGSPFSVDEALFIDAYPKLSNQQRRRWLTSLPVKIFDNFYARIRDLTDTPVGMPPSWQTARQSAFLLMRTIRNDEPETRSKMFERAFRDPGQARTFARFELEDRRSALVLQILAHPGVAQYRNELQALTTLLPPAPTGPPASGRDFVELLHTSPKGFADAVKALEPEARLSLARELATLAEDMAHTVVNLPEDGHAVVRWQERAQTALDQMKGLVPKGSSIAPYSVKDLRTERAGIEKAGLDAMKAAFAKEKGSAYQKYLAARAAFTPHEVNGQDLERRLEILLRREWTATKLTYDTQDTMIVPWLRPYPKAEEHLLTPASRLQFALDVASRSTPQLGRLLRLLRLTATTGSTPAIRDSAAFAIAIIEGTIAARHDQRGFAALLPLLEIDRHGTLGSLEKEEVRPFADYLLYRALDARALMPKLGGDAEKAARPFREARVALMAEKAVPLADRGFALDLWNLSNTELEARLANEPPHSLIPLLARMQRVRTAMREGFAVTAFGEDPDIDRPIRIATEWLRRRATERLEQFSKASQSKDWTKIEAQVDAMRSARLHAVLEHITSPPKGAAPLPKELTDTISPLVTEHAEAWNLSSLLVSRHPALPTGTTPLDTVAHLREAAEAWKGWEKDLKDLSKTEKDHLQGWTTHLNSRYQAALNGKLGPQSEKSAGRPPHPPDEVIAWWLALDHRGRNLALLNGQILRQELTPLRTALEKRANEAKGNERYYLRLAWMRAKESDVDPDLFDVIYKRPLDRDFGKATTGPMPDGREIRLLETLRRDRRQPLQERWLAWGLRQRAIEQDAHAREIAGLGASPKALSALLAPGGDASAKIDAAFRKTLGKSPPGVIASFKAGEAEAKQRIFTDLLARIPGITRADLEKHVVLHAVPQPGGTVNFVAGLGPGSTLPKEMVTRHAAAWTKLESDSKEKLYTAYCKAAGGVSVPEKARIVPNRLADPAFCRQFLEKNFVTRAAIDSEGAVSFHLAIREESPLVSLQAQQYLNYDTHYRDGGMEISTWSHYNDHSPNSTPEMLHWYALLGDSSPHDRRAMRATSSSAPGLIDSSSDFLWVIPGGGAVKGMSKLGSIAANFGVRAAVRHAVVRGTRLMAIGASFGVGLHAAGVVAAKMDGLRVEWSQLWTGTPEAALNGAIMAPFLRYTYAVIPVTMHGVEAAADSFSKGHVFTGIVQSAQVTMPIWLHRLMQPRRGPGALVPTEPSAEVPNFFARLGLNENATMAEVRAAYRRLAREHHPDRGGDAAKFREATEAYRALEQIFREPALLGQYRAFLNGGATPTMQIPGALPGGGQPIALLPAPPKGGGGTPVIASPVSLPVHSGGAPPVGAKGYARAMVTLEVSSLTPFQRAMLESAHQIGHGQPGRLPGTSAGILPSGQTNYTNRQLALKIRELMRIDPETGRPAFTREQAHALVRAGIVGETVDPWSSLLEGPLSRRHAGSFGRLRGRTAERNALIEQALEIPAGGPDGRTGQIPVWLQRAYDYGFSFRSLNPRDIANLFNPEQPGLVSRGTHGGQENLEATISNDTSPQYHNSRYIPTTDLPVGLVNQGTPNNCIVFDTVALQRAGTPSHPAGFIAVEQVYSMMMANNASYRPGPYVIRPAHSMATRTIPITGQGGEPVILYAVIHGRRYTGAQLAALRTPGRMQTYHGIEVSADGHTFSVWQSGTGGRPGPTRENIPIENLPPGIRTLMDGNGGYYHGEVTFDTTTNQVITVGQ